MLICRPVSSRSDESKIRRWISELEAKRERYQDDPSALEMIDHCVRQATVWLSPRESQQPLREEMVAQSLREAGS